MAHNPYTPPSARVEDRAEVASAAAPSERLYSPGQLGLAAFLGSPLAAAWFARANFKALGQPLKAGWTMLAGVVVTIIVFGIAYVLPDRTPNTFFPVLYSVVIRQIAQPFFVEPIKEHQRAGGRLASWWKVVGVSLLIVLLPLAACVVVVGVLIAMGVIPVE